MAEILARAQGRGGQGIFVAQLAADAAAFGGVAAPGVTSELSGFTKGTVVDSALAGPTDWQSTLIHDDDLPRLPREFEALREPHRERHGSWHPPGCIARKLSKREMDACPKARKALVSEWEKLRFLKRPSPVKGEGAWNEGNVREASSVRDAAHAAGKTVHFGRIVELCHEKGSELALDDPERKMKGRSVLLGDNVKDHDFNWASSVNLVPARHPGTQPKRWMLSAPSQATPLRLVMPKALILKLSCLAPRLGSPCLKTGGLSIGNASSIGLLFG